MTALLKCDEFNIVADGSIMRFLRDGDDTDADTIFDCTNCEILPGLFDMHVHFRDPGQTYKEDLHSGAAAAVMGGVTGVLCMPNTVPVIDTADAAREFLRRAGDENISIYTAGAITRGQLGKELSDFVQLKNAGVLAVSDDGHPVSDDGLMREALYAAKEAGILIISHCEDLNLVNGGIIHDCDIARQLGVRGNPREAEYKAVERDVLLAAETGGTLHIAHVSTAESVEIIRNAKRDGVRVTCETAPHYFTDNRLCLTVEQLLKKDADYRMNPPLRERSDVAAIIAGLIDGTVDCIATDHAPHSPVEKVNFETAPNGVIGLATSVAAGFEAGFDADFIREKMYVNPRKILGLPYEGLIDGGCADICVIRKHQWTVDPGRLGSKSRNSCFKKAVFGHQVKYTFSKGKLVFSAV